MSPVRGIVYADKNGDGVRQPGEPGVGGVVVAVDRAVFATTAADGSFEFLSPVDMGRLWARVPDGFWPGLAWKTYAIKPVQLPLVPLPAPRPGEPPAPLTFIVAADTHVPLPGGDWDGGDLGDAFEQAVALPVRPRFFTVLGDITGGNQEIEFDRVAEALKRIAYVPWVPVAGNHDWYDGGGTYRRRLGPASYSFDIDDVHFVVWDTNQDAADQIAFLTGDLARVPHAMTTVALAHHSPLDDVADAMEALGVDYVFSAHWHANRRIRRGTMVEWSTQPLIMSGIDQSAPGYRVVTFVDGKPTVHTRERVIHPHVGLVSPHPGSCASASGFTLRAAAALDAAVPRVRARIDCGPELPLAPSGGWSFAREIDALAPGTHVLTLAATGGRGRTVETTHALEVCADERAPQLDDASWPQLGGGPQHHGARDAAITPPLTERWTATVGGRLSLGSPVIANGTIVVVTTDGDAGDQGGAVALDLTSGSERWRYRMPDPAVGTAAIGGDTVVLASKAGEIHAVSLVDGSVRWTRDLAGDRGAFETSLWAPPVIADGRVYVALQSNFAALDLATGDIVWSRDPADPAFHWLATLAPVAVAKQLAITAFNRTLGIGAADLRTGAPAWTVIEPLTRAVNSMVATDDTVYVINDAGELSAIAVATGAVRWTTPLVAGAIEWHYPVTATPALANGTLFVATQWNDLVAVDAATGTVRWRARAAPGPLNFAHYKSAQAGWAGAPTVTGELVWIGGLDGTLTAFRASTGARAWSTQLGAPITSAPAPAGDALVIASYDGSVRLFAPGTPIAPRTMPRCPFPPPPSAASAAQPASSSEGCATHGATSLAGLLFILGVLSGTRRRRTARAAESRVPRRTDATRASRPRR